MIQSIIIYTNLKLFEVFKLCEIANNDIVVEVLGKKRSLRAEKKSNTFKIVLLHRLEELENFLYLRFNEI